MVASTRTLFGFHSETPDDRLREGFFHCPAFQRVVGDGAIALVRLDQEHLRAVADKANHKRSADLAAIETDIVRSHTGRKRMDIKKIGIPARDFEENMAGFGFVIHREIAGERGHPCHFFCYAGSGGRSPGSLGCERRAGEKEQNCPHEADVNLDAH